MAFVVDKTAELISLEKALRLIKFQGEEYEAHYLAVSPYSGDLLKRISSELSDHYTSIHSDYRSQFGSIESMPHYLAGLKIHLSHIDSWSILTKDVQMAVILDLDAPFTIDQQTINDLLKNTSLT